MYAEMPSRTTDIKNLDYGWLCYIKTLAHFIFIDPIFVWGSTKPLFPLFCPTPLPPLFQMIDLPKMFFSLKFPQICWFPGQRRRPEQRPCPSFVAPPVGTPKQRLPPRLGWSVHSHSTTGVCPGQASRTEGPGHIYQFCCSPPGPTHKLFTQVLSDALDTKQYTVIC